MTRSCGETADALDSEFSPVQGGSSNLPTSTTFTRRSIDVRITFTDMDPPGMISYTVTNGDETAGFGGPLIGHDAYGVAVNYDKAVKNFMFDLTKFVNAHGFTPV